MDLFLLYEIMQNLQIAKMKKNPIMVIQINSACNECMWLSINIMSDVLKMAVENCE